MTTTDTPPAAAKPWYKSRTLWINILTGAAAIAGAFGFDVGLDEETKLRIGGGGMALMNVVLRLITKAPVA